MSSPMSMLVSGMPNSSVMAAVYSSGHSATLLTAAERGRLASGLPDSHGVQMQILRFSVTMTASCSVRNADRLRPLLASGHRPVRTSSVIARQLRFSAGCECPAASSGLIRRAFVTSMRG